MQGGGLGMSEEASGSGAGGGACSGQLSQCPGPLSQAERSQLKGTAGHACPVVARGIKGCILIDCAPSRQTPHHSLPQPHSNVTHLMYEVQSGSLPAPEQCAGAILALTEFSVGLPAVTLRPNPGFACDLRLGVLSSTSLKKYQKKNIL